MLVKIEIWMGMGKLLGEDFHSPSSLRSEIELDVEDGISVRSLFSQLSVRYPAIGEKIFDITNGEFLPDVIATFNDEVIWSRDLSERILESSDNIKIFPMDAGG